MYISLRELVNVVNFGQDHFNSFYFLALHMEKRGWFFSWSFWQYWCSHVYQNSSGVLLPFCKRRLLVLHITGLSQPQYNLEPLTSTTLILRSFSSKCMIWIHSLFLMYPIMSLQDGDFDSHVHFSHMDFFKRIYYKYLFTRGFL